MALSEFLERLRVVKPKVAPPCPTCGSHQVAEFLYGLPDLDRLRPDLEAGRVVLGGCCLFEDSPQWKCHACGHEWGRAVDFDELRRLRLEAKAVPKSFWQRFQSWIGISLEDEQTFLNGLARRLAWLTIGVALAFALAAITSPWVGLAILVIWWIPLAWNIVLRFLAAAFGIGLTVVAVVGIRPLNSRRLVIGLRMIGFLVFTCLEIILLICSFSYAGGWLLSEAMVSS
jgi:hypothetical protein